MQRTVPHVAAALLAAIGRIHLILPHTHRPTIHRAAVAVGAAAVGPVAVSQGGRRLVLP